MAGIAQNSTFSPYSRYALGERAPTGDAPVQAMGGTFIAWRPDSTMPVFINQGNPASYALLRFTSLEVGGRYNYSRFLSAGDKFPKWGTNFSYAAIGVPLGSRAGLCFGISPYSHVGYNSQSPGANDINNQYAGNGDVTRVHIGAGIMPFRNAWVRFRRFAARRPDSLPPLSRGSYRLRSVCSRFLSDLSVGANLQYFFGDITTTTRIVYPNTVLYRNSYFERTLNIADFSGNFGLQGGFTVDSARAKNGHGRRALKQQSKFVFGLTGSLQNPLHVVYNEVAYNYIVNSSGGEVLRDTLIFNVEQHRRMTLPLEAGAGLGFKKGEKLQVMVDAALTGWSKFVFPGQTLKFTDSYRFSAGLNYVPEKYAAGRSAFLRRVNYRFGVSHETGYMVVNGLRITNSFVSAGIGMPVGVGRISSMVHASLQLGMLGPGFGVKSNDVITEQYFRVHFGFTFCDRWFQKFRYD